MALDASIPLQARGVEMASPLDVASKAMTLKQLAMQNAEAERQSEISMRKIADEQSVRDAFAKNIGPEGLNRKAALSDLYRAAPEKALDFQKMFSQFDDDEFKRITAVAKQLAWSVNDEPSYQAARQRAIQLGLPNSDKLPEQFIPTFVQRWQLGTLEGEKQLAQMNEDRKFKADQEAKDKEYRLKKEELGAKRSEATGKKGKDAMELAANLRKERSGLPVTRATQEISAAYNKIQEAAQSPSAAGDMSLIFGYMKILDPGSTVREGEFANAQNATGVPGRILNLYNKIINGERLSPEQRQDFLSQAGGLYKAQMNLQSQVDSQFASYATQAGVNPNDVVVNFSAQRPKPKGKKPLGTQSSQVFKTNQIDWAD